MDASYTIKTMELHEITSRIMLSQVPASSRFAESLGLPQLRATADVSVAITLDSCLKKWEQRLPPALRLDSPADPAGSEPADGAQRLMLHLR
jgi:hypothetical protein